MKHGTNISDDRKKKTLDTLRLGEEAAMLSLVPENFRSVRLCYLHVLYGRLFTHVECSTLANVPHIYALKM